MERRTLVYAILVAMYAYAFIRVATVETIIAVAVAAIWPFIYKRVPHRRFVLLALFASGIAALIYVVAAQPKSAEVSALPIILLGLFAVLAFCETKR